MNNINIDWNLIKKEYDKLKVPRDLSYYPNFSNIVSNTYNVILSERNRGKTTTMLLIGLLLYKYYGIVTQYLRQNEEQAKPKDLAIYDVINSFENGRYIKAIFGNSYDSIEYRSAKWFLVKYNEENKVINKSTEICHLLIVDNHLNYKSSYNAPFGDWIILDEFISKFGNDDTYAFFDLLSTIIRKRTTTKIILLANTLNCGHSKYLEELEILGETKKLQRGDSKSITTGKGTKVCVEVIAPPNKENKKQSILNKLYFGFNNPKLVSITGEGNIWDIYEYPHILKADYKSEINHISFIDNIFIKLGAFDYLRCDFCYNDIQKNHIEIYRNGFKPNRPSDIILTLDNPIYNNEYFGLGNKKILNLFREMLNNNAVYYATNECGSDFENYLLNYKSFIMSQID